jgi:hypothetical protein
MILKFNLERRLLEDQQFLPGSNLEFVLETLPDVLIFIIIFWENLLLTIALGSILTLPEINKGVVEGV